MSSDAHRWALNNAHLPEGRAQLAEEERLERIRKAHEPKRFIVRRVRPGLWTVRDQARALWAWSVGSHAAAMSLLSLAAKDHGPWDGRVRVRVVDPNADTFDTDFDYWG